MLPFDTTNDSLLTPLSMPIYVSLPEYVCFCGLQMLYEAQIKLYYQSYKYVSIIANLM